MKSRISHFVISPPSDIFIVRALTGSSLKYMKLGHSKDWHALHFQPDEIANAGLIALTRLSALMYGVPYEA